MNEYIFSSKIARLRLAIFPWAGEGGLCEKKLLASLTIFHGRGGRVVCVKRCAFDGCAASTWHQVSVSAWRQVTVSTWRQVTVSTWGQVFCCCLGAVAARASRSNFILILKN
jgi:hypothetical protein